MDLNKRRTMAPQEQVMHLVAECPIFHGKDGLVPFVQMVFMQLLARFVH